MKAKYRSALINITSKAVRSSRWIAEFDNNHSGILEFARSYKDFGIH